jgi:hypothetical protein
MTAEIVSILSPLDPPFKEKGTDTLMAKHEMASTSAAQVLGWKQRCKHRQSKCQRQTC